jgi:aspartate aminotransferase-like enzyme
MASQNLRTPGPTPLPPEVREALARDMVNHRGPEFGAILRDCTDGLKWAYQVSAHDMLIVTASGTGGLESLVANTLSPGDKLLVASIGNFGERMANISRIFGVDVTRLDFQPGTAIDPNRLEDALRKNPEIQTVHITHNETSTGVLNPLQDVARAVRNVRREALLLVDGISSVGSVEVKPEDWDLDVVVAGSQKGWMTPPGLAFVSVSPRAWERQSRSTSPKFYFDWQAARKSAASGETPWTPAVSLFYALQAGLKLMQQEGLQHVFQRHKRLAQYTRDGLADLDVRLVADPRFASPTVTTAYLPDGVNGKALLNALDDRHGVVLAGGQGNLTGKVFRIGHMGWVDQDDLDAVLHAVKVELNSIRAAPAAGR